MNARLHLLLGSEVDLATAQLCRRQVLLETITSLQNRLQELGVELAAEEDRTGDARRAAEAQAAELRQQDAAAERERASIAVSQRTLLAANDRIWVKIQRLLRRWLSDDRPDKLALNLSACNAELATAEQAVAEVRQQLALVDKQLQRYLAPIADVEFACDCLQRDLVSAEAEVDELNHGVVATLVRGLTERPLWTLRHAVASDPDLDLDELLALRRQLHGCGLRPKRTGPPPLPKSGATIARGIADGFYEESGRAGGSVTVTGSGRKRVRRTRTVRDREGRMRTESYWTTVGVRFHGAVEANYSVAYRRWQASPFGEFLAATVDANLNAAAPTATSAPIAAVQRLLTLGELPTDLLQETPAAIPATI